MRRAKDSAGAPTWAAVIKAAKELFLEHSGRPWSDRDAHRFENVRVAVEVEREALEVLRQLRSAVSDGAEILARPDVANARRRIASSSLRELHAWFGRNPNAESLRPGNDRTRLTVRRQVMAIYGSTEPSRDTRTTTEGTRLKRWPRARSDAELAAISLLVGGDRDIPDGESVETVLDAEIRAYRAIRRRTGRRSRRSTAPGT